MNPPVSPPRIWTVLGVIVTFLASSGEAFNFYYITEGKRGETHDINDAQQQRISIFALAIMVLIYFYKALLTTT